MVLWADEVGDMKLDKQGDFLSSPQVTHDNGIVFCCNSEVGKGGVYGMDPLNRIKTTKTMECSHLEEIVQMWIFSRILLRW